jgi:hypothetical protein
MNPEGLIRLAVAGKPRAFRPGVDHDKRHRSENETHEAVEFWRLRPKPRRPYFNIRDRKSMQDRGDDRGHEEIPSEKVTEGWAAGTEAEVHVKFSPTFVTVVRPLVHIHSEQHDQRRVIEFYGKESPASLAEGYLGQSSVDSISFIFILRTLFRTAESTTDRFGCFFRP